MNAAVTGGVQGKRCGALEAALAEARAQGRKIVVPYVTGGLAPTWPETVAAVASAGADAVEVGIPFSDPVMDGPVIQEASRRALEAGASPQGVLAQATRGGPGVPLVAMTYYNIAYHMGLERFAASLVGAGFAAAILPDLPLEESGPWRVAGGEAGVETVMLVAPSTPDDRMEQICAAASGFVYGVGLMGVTGERKDLALSALDVARRLKAVTDLPVLIGVGVTNADHARAVCEVADGVIVGSALVRRLLAGGGPQQAAEFISEIRAGLDRG